MEKNFNRTGIASTMAEFIRLELNKSKQENYNEIGFPIDLQKT